MIVLTEVKIKDRPHTVVFETNSHNSEYLVLCRVLEQASIVEEYTVRRVDYPTMTPVHIDLFNEDEHIRVPAKMHKWKQRASNKAI